LILRLILSMNEVLRSKNDLSVKQISGYQI
jgi:hypothetical protein